jgi:flavodoxin
MNTLVVYFSLTGSTEFVAKIISEQLNADLCEVVDKKHKKEN